MVVGVFPALKLAVLFVKQISKPLAKFLVSQAKSHPLFRAYVIIPPAQFYHWAEVKTKMYLMNLGKPVKVAKLNETMAIELGANLMGEVIIFGVAGGCIMFEYNRQVAKELKKEEARLQQIQMFKDDIEDLKRITSSQQNEMQQLQLALKTLAKCPKYELLEKLLVNEPNQQEQHNPDRNQDINNTLKTNKKSYSRENEKTSLIERAIVYYENDVKANKIS